MDYDYLSLIMALVPEMSEVMQERLRLIECLAQQSARMGRLALAERLNISERTARNHIDTLRNQGVVDVNRAGVQLTAQGIDLFNDLIKIIGYARQPNFSELELAVMNQLELQACHIVAGDADNDQRVLDRLGEKVQMVMEQRLPIGYNVVAVTGGSTLARIGRNFTTDLSHHRDIYFVSSRGGVIGSVEIQSNSVCEMMAAHTGAHYVPLYIPETLQQETAEIILQDPDIDQVVSLSQQANCLLLSIGQAQLMAERRNLSTQQQIYLQEKEAVGEAFGVFYNQDGEIILRRPRIGLQIEDVEQIPLVITIVGGASKAEALQAFYKVSSSHGCLVCDEALAESVLNGDASPLK